MVIKGWVIKFNNRRLITGRWHMTKVAAALIYVTRVIPVWSAASETVQCMWLTHEEKDIIYTHLYHLEERDRAKVLRLQKLLRALIETQKVFLISPFSKCKIWLNMSPITANTVIQSFLSYEQSRQQKLKKRERSNASIAFQQIICWLIKVVSP